MCGRSAKAWTICRRPTPRCVRRWPSGCGAKGFPRSSKSSAGSIPTIAIGWTATIPHGCCGRWKSGRPFSAYRTGVRRKRDFGIVKLGVDLPREVLYERIDRRVDLMMEAGLEAEARALYPFRRLNALQTVGYKELFAYFDGTCTREEAVALIKRNTRRYAKRQLTWFRRDGEIRWFAPDRTEEMISCIDLAFRK